MIARAAELPGIWPHVVALAWQVLWVALILNLVSRIFRRSVLKSGPVRSTMAAQGRPRLGERCFGLFLQPRLHGHVREGPVADPRNPGAGPCCSARPSGEVHGVHR